MAWLSGLTGKAENFLNSLDQKAASVLTEEPDQTNPNLRSSVVQSDPKAIRGSAQHELSGPSHTPFLSAQSKPSTLAVTKHPETKTPDTAAGSTTPVKAKTGDQAVKKKTDTDEALFEFLNSPAEATERKRSTPGNSTRHSRQSSASSVISNKGGRGSNDGQASSSTSGSSMVHVEMPGRLILVISVSPKYLNILKIYCNDLNLTKTTCFTLEKCHQ